MKKQLFILTYGCQMNFADSELLNSILIQDGYENCQDYKKADLILINTCSIRDNAEQRVLNKLREFIAQRRVKPSLKVGIVGCMAERLKEELFAQNINVDLVIGPDAYRNLPQLLRETPVGQKAINVLLSEEETYHDIEPIRLGDNKISAFISIMRGCENYCSYCVVPYTRGKERSRAADTILKDAQQLFDKGYREVCLLGQNVNSYAFENTSFAQLLARTAEISPLLRVRFSSSHPKDLPQELLDAIALYPNICKHIHLPFQSGSNAILAKMKRNYTRESYRETIKAIRKTIPDCGLSTDLITGFCSESEQDHQESLSLMREISCDFAFMFKYSERPGTFAAKHYPDDVPEEIKSRRLDEIIQVQQEIALNNNQKRIGQVLEVLIEGPTKKSPTQFHGRSTQNTVVVFENSNYSIGDYVLVKIESCTKATLMGSLIQ